MKDKLKVALYLLPTIAVVLLGMWFLQGENALVVNPKGMIAHKEKNLLVAAVFIMLPFVIAVFVLALRSAWKYRASNKAEYAPDWDYNLFIEILWWGVPFLAIIVLSLMVWFSSHELDPFKPLESDKKPVRIQVVALQWKWLFIYPDHNIATLNFFQIPEHTPINFEVTADAPMNSFWMPQLGGQIYAMPGMRTKLHLIANTPGDYNGFSANLSGKGFAGMHFICKASSEAEFEAWVKQIKGSSKPLSKQSYQALAEPSENNPVASYLTTKEDLFDWIVMKYMMP